MPPEAPTSAASPAAGVGPPAPGAVVLVHASCVAWGEVGILLRGRSGSGKSDLALRLIEAGALLVGDDQIGLERDGQALLARPAPALAGLIEVRGLGVIRLPHRPLCRVALVVDLAQAAAIDRLPRRRACRLENVTLPWMRLDPGSQSATARVRFAIEATRVH